MDEVLMFAAEVVADDRISLKGAGLAVGLLGIVVAVGMLAARRNGRK